MVIGLQRDALVPVIGADPAFIIPQTVNMPEAILNSGDASDSEILAEYPRRILIHETTRLDILLRSVSTRERFLKSRDTFYELPSDERTVRNLVKILSLRDETAPGQLARENEMKSMNKLNKDESSNEKSAMVATTPVGKYPLGSCMYHPLTTNHTSEQCRKGFEKHKKPYEVRHCNNCEKYNPKRYSYKTHNTSECTYKAPPGAQSYGVIATDAPPEPAPAEAPTRKKRKPTESAFVIANPANDEDEARRAYILQNYDQFKSLVSKNPNYKKK
jgi:hypothetical protein